jgi:two-component system sensor histidine kinase BaeS
VPSFPRLTLQGKAFAALSALLVVMLLIFVGFSRIGLQRGLGPYVAEIELARMDWLAYRLQAIYVQHGGWQTLHGQPGLWRELRRPRNLHMPVIGPTTPPPDPLLLHTPEPSAQQPVDALSRRLGVVDARGALVAGAPPRPGGARTALGDGEGRTVGHLVLAPPDGLERDADRAFLAKQLGFVVWTGVAGLALALLLSWWLARRWLRPIGALVQGAQALAAGRLQARVPEQADSEEFTRLIHTFNDMAEQLASMEASRRQWIGDMAHELRTPLAAMRAEIEAVQDGVRRFDARTAQRLHRQVMRLIHLVGDLRASVDMAGGEPPAALAPVRPLALLREAMAAMQSRFDQAGVALHALPDLAVLATAQGGPRVRGDAQQLHRVFLNLLENSLRYTDPGGRLEVSAGVQRGHLQLRLDDTAPGALPHELPHLFERLYRAEASRHRAVGDLGGSGLGLAICRTIVQAHGGHIEASASPLGGLRIALTLPLLEEPA